MGREILFRAKMKNKNKWVYGDLISPKNNENSYGIFELDGGCVKVVPKTIGQYTGLKDITGKKIYEGDIIEFDEREWGCKHFEEVKFDYEYLDMRKNDFKQWCVVVGNKWDNPELLQ